MTDSNSKPSLLGGLFLIIGTCIGGSMLALPMATANAGFGFGACALIVGYLTMTLGAFFILEANLWFPENSNLLTMTAQTLGPMVRNCTWVLYLILFINLLSAYIAAGSDLVRSITETMGLHPANWVNQFIFTVTLGTVVRFGVKCVDWANRGLMIGKIAGYLILVSLIIPSIKLPNLIGSNPHALVGALAIAINSFGYSPIIPSLRTYYASDSQMLHKAVFWGSIVPLICYLIWNLTIQGNISRMGANGLIQISKSSSPVHDLSLSLINLGISGVHTATTFFIAICVATSFLGVALCLKDFLADGLNIKQSGHNSTILVIIALTPSFILDLINDKLFIVGLSMAGTICVILLIILPGMMVWSGRYRQNRQSSYQIRGGKPLVIMQILAGSIILLNIAPPMLSKVINSFGGF